MTRGENEQLSQLVRVLVGSCCLELFAAYGVVLQPCDGEFITCDGLLFSGAVGFVGDQVCGSCLLVADLEPILRSSPSANPRDWIGELTNQLVGRVKRKILGYGLDIQLTTPVMLSGVQLRPTPRKNQSPRLFSSGAGAVMVWVEVEAEPDFVLGTPVADAAGTEGDILVF